MPFSGAVSPSAPGRRDDRRPCCPRLDFGAIEISLGPTDVMLGGDLRQFRYTHPANLGFIPCEAASGTCTTVVGRDTNYRGGPCPNADPGCVTVIGHSAYEAALGSGQAYVPSFTAFERDDDARIGVKVAAPRIYLAAGYLWRNPGYLGYPNQHGIGFGLEKLPDLDRPLSIYGSAYYYPSVSGTYTGPTSIYLGALSGAQFTLSYRVLKYEIGWTYASASRPSSSKPGFSAIAVPGNRTRRRVSRATASSSAAGSICDARYTPNLNSGDVRPHARIETRRVSAAKNSDVELT